MASKKSRKTGSDVKNEAIPQALGKQPLLGPETTKEPAAAADDFEVKTLRVVIFGDKKYPDEFLYKPRLVVDDKARTAHYCSPAVDAMWKMGMCKVERHEREDFILWCRENGLRLHQVHYPGELLAEHGFHTLGS